MGLAWLCRNTCHSLHSLNEWDSCEDGGEGKGCICPQNNRQSVRWQGRQVVQCLCSGGPSRDGILVQCRGQRNKKNRRAFSEDCNLKCDLLLGSGEVRC